MAVKALLVDESVGFIEAADQYLVTTLATRGAAQHCVTNQKLSVGTAQGQPCQVLDALCRNSLCVCFNNGIICL